MTDFDMPEPSRLMIAGDWHSNRHWAKRMIEVAEHHKVKAILQVGDFGYWPTYSEQDCRFTGEVMEHCERVGIPLYWVDGNHENHSLLQPGQGDRWVRHLPRGHRWSWWGKTWMAVGGGVSVDKKWRTPGKDWFPEETLTPAQFEQCMRDGEVDVIVSHDCPDGVLIPGTHALSKQGKDEDGTLVQAPPFPIEQLHESEAHRGLLGAMATKFHPGHWFHGHYHSRYNAQLAKTMIVGLGADAGRDMTDNFVIITAKDLT